jgi:uncharacterized membrane protein YgaE (UPF0421/DUF939 family)
MTNQLLAVAAALLQAEGIPAGASTLRTVVRVLLGVLIGLLLAYIAIEQIGAWRRRRHGDD